MPISKDVVSQEVPNQKEKNVAQPVAKKLASTLANDPRWMDGIYHNIYILCIIIIIIYQYII
jgi:hypothetical protein